MMYFSSIKLFFILVARITCTTGNGSLSTIPSHPYEVIQKAFNQLPWTSSSQIFPSGASHNDVQHAAEERKYTATQFRYYDDECDGHDSYSGSSYSGASQSSSYYNYQQGHSSSHQQTSNQAYNKVKHVSQPTKLHTTNNLYKNSPGKISVYASSHHHPPREPSINKRKPNYKKGPSPIRIQQPNYSQNHKSSVKGSKPPRLTNHKQHLSSISPQYGQRYAPNNAEYAKPYSSVKNLPYSAKPTTSSNFKHQGKPKSNGYSSQKGLPHSTREATPPNYVQNIFKQEYSSVQNTYNNIYSSTNNFYTPTPENNPPPSIPLTQYSSLSTQPQRYAKNSKALPLQYNAPLPQKTDVFSTYYPELTTNKEYHARESYFPSLSPIGSTQYNEVNEVSKSQPSVPYSPNYQFAPNLENQHLNEIQYPNFPNPPHPEYQSSAIPSPAIRQVVSGNLLSSSQDQSTPYSFSVHSENSYLSSRYGYPNFKSQPPSVQSISYNYNNSPTYNPESNYISDVPENYAKPYNNYVPINYFNHLIKPGDGAYDIEFGAGNGINHHESGYLKRIPVYCSNSLPGYNSNDQQSILANVKTGSVSWTSPEGIPFTMSYIADENGFRLIGSHIPTTTSAETTYSN